MNVPSSTGSGAHLRPVIGVLALAAGIVNLIVGAGIFRLPADVAAVLGSQAWIAYILCSLATALVLLCFAVGGSRISKTGGPYMYVQAALGPFPAFLAGVLLWVAAACASAAVASAFAGFLVPVFQLAETGVGQVIAVFSLYGLAMLINARGVQYGTRTVTTLTACKVLPLVTLVLAGGALLLIGHLPPPPEITTPITSGAIVAPAQTLTVDAIARAALVLIFAFTGSEVALAPSGEIRHPARTVPLAIGAALCIVTVLYLSIQATAQAALGPALALDEEIRKAPLAAVGFQFFGSAGKVAITLAALVSTSAYILGDVLASPRVLYALAEDGHLPRILAHVHPKRRTPTIAILLHGCTAATLAVSGTFERLMLLNNVALLVLYLACSVAAIVLLRREVASTNGSQEVGQATETSASPPFTPPLGPVIPILSCVVLLWLLTHAKVEEFKGVGAAIGIATVAYALRWGREKTSNGQPPKISSSP